jgi:hypothetical protein
MQSAVLFLIFNRPDTTQQVFEAIRAAKPPRLYVAADGPRQNREGEFERCEEVRKIATTVDWPCEVKTLFRNENLGCKLGVSGGINWFFENEEEGIILEDDVLPLPSFFEYCDELLERYRHDPNVGVISGCNLISKRFKTAESYFFSRYNLIWGWASWRRTWQHYDVNMHDWPEWRDKGGIKSISDGNKLFESYWNAIFDNVYRGGIDTWDYQLIFSCWYHGMVTALPALNQTFNIGFGHPDAVHTTANTPSYVNESIPETLIFPLSHPITVERSIAADATTDRLVLGITKREFMRQRIMRIPMIGNLMKEIKRLVKNA